MSKKYKLCKSEPYTALRDVISQKTNHLLNLIKGDKNQSKGEKMFFALKNLSFSVKSGEVLGIIGKNGAGKSTLLKIISKITPPTSGELTYDGRVGSLLEVGTGFHPELTGNENIFLNGILLGMSKREIKASLKDIIDFSEIGEFINTPVKYYSSGMYTRLAFSVVAFLKTEILIVDEVLSVGDLQFQNKSFNKMKSVSKDGRTILFVSHNLSAIEALCHRVLYLERGEMVEIGPTKSVVKKYISSIKHDVDKPLVKRLDRVGKGKIKIYSVSFPNAKPGNIYQVGDLIKVTLSVDNTYGTAVPVRFSMSIFTESQQGLISCDMLQQNLTLKLPVGKNKVSCELDKIFLNYGVYHINIAVFYGNEPEDWISSASKFMINSGTYSNIINFKNYNPILNNFRWKLL